MLVNRKPGLAVCQAPSLRSFVDHRRAHSGAVAKKRKVLRPSQSNCLRKQGVDECMNERLVCLDLLYPVESIEENIEDISGRKLQTGAGMPFLGNVEDECSRQMPEDVSPLAKELFRLLWYTPQGVAGLEENDLVLLSGSTASQVLNALFELYSIRKVVCTEYSTWFVNV